MHANTALLDYLYQAGIGTIILNSICGYLLLGHILKCFCKMFFVIIITYLLIALKEVRRMDPIPQPFPLPRSPSSHHLNRTRLEYVLIILFISYYPSIHRIIFSSFLYSQRAHQSSLPPFTPSLTHLLKPNSSPKFFGIHRFFRL